MSNHLNDKRGKKLLLNSKLESEIHNSLLSYPPSQLLVLEHYAATFQISRYW